MCSFYSFDEKLAAIRVVLDGWVEDVNKRLISG